jgi:ribosome-associated translation inhibitor RaiA
MAEEPTHDVYAGIDLVMDKILGQIRKQKTKILNKRTEKNVNMGVTEEDLDVE